MKLNRTLALLVVATLNTLFSGGGNVSLADEKPSINWHSYNLPPGMCIDITTEHDCFVDYMVSLLQEKLAGDYQHKKYPTSLKRLLFELNRAEELIVAPALLHNQARAEFIQFSYSSPLPRLPYVVVVRQEDEDSFAPFLNAEGLINLEQLMSSSKKTVLLETRSYGHLNETIEQYGSNVETFVSFDNLKGMSFLQLKRIDYLIVYPTHASFAVNHLKEKGFQILTYPIQNSPLYLVSRLGTVKSESGNVLMEKLNRLLYDEELTKQSIESYRAWLPDNLKKHFDKVSKQYQIDRIEIDKENE